ncbi:very short patch repair endonuclease [Microbacterium sp. 179-B 1A2 NHS]|uniref:very short patch repair endonuclease n=1 Tax=Microbacterium sp. 179-B 1A2 NHS TaxID=3142383 RepID=UPI0039A3E8C7
MGIERIVRKPMKGNRSRDTEPELAVRRRLHAAGLRYRVDYRPVPTINRRADIVFTRQRVAVFIDGCFWHGCPIHFVASRTNAEYWEPKIARNIERDAQTDELLREHGWTTARFWSHEQPDSVAAAVQAVVAPAERTEDAQPAESGKEFRADCHKHCCSCV